MHNHRRSRPVPHKPVIRRVPRLLLAAGYALVAFLLTTTVISITFPPLHITTRR